MSHLPDMTSVIFVETCALSGLCRQILRDDFSIATRLKALREIALHVCLAVLPVGSSWLEVLDRVQLLVSMMYCFLKQPVQCWQPRESFHLPFSTFPVAYQTKYNFLLMFWRRDDTVALSTSKTDFFLFY